MPVAHIGHVELLVPDIDASTEFFEEMLGLYVSDRVDGRAFMRAWQDCDHHTLVLTEAAERQSSRTSAGGCRRRPTRSNRRS